MVVARFFLAQGRGFLTGGSVSIGLGVKYKPCHLTDPDEYTGIKKKLTKGCVPAFNTQLRKTLG